MGYVESEHHQSSVARRRPGVFIPWSVLVLAGIIMVSTSVTVIILLVPTIGIPVAVGVGVASLLFSIWTSTRGPGSDGGP